MIDFVWVLSISRNVTMYIDHEREKDEESLKCEIESTSIGLLRIRLKISLMPSLAYIVTSRLAHQHKSTRIHVPWNQATTLWSKAPKKLGWKRLSLDSLHPPSGLVPQLLPWSAITAGGTKLRVAWVTRNSFNPSQTNPPRALSCRRGWKILQLAVKNHQKNRATSYWN